jgi:hypothetical protein
MSRKRGAPGACRYDFYRNPRHRSFFFDRHEDVIAKDCRRRLDFTGYDQVVERLSGHRMHGNVLAVSFLTNSSPLNLSIAPTN